MSGEPAGPDLLRELAPVAERALARHLAVATEWFPHEYVPWDRGRDRADRCAEPDGATRLPAGARAAFELNLLTEENLPSYHAELLAHLGSAGVWGAWVNRWTAEEGRHAAVIRDYLLVTRAVDPVALERDRMATVQRGYTAGAKTVLRALAYLALQELATRVAHRNTGRAAGDPVAERLCARVAADENLHMVFYRDLMAAALRVVPGAAVAAIADEVVAFTMPGAGAPGFQRRSVAIADAGIFDVRAYRDEVVLPLLRYWDVLGMRLDGDGGRRAQRRLTERVGELDAIAERYERRRAARASLARDGHQPGDADPVQHENRERVDAQPRDAS